MAKVIIKHSGKRWLIALMGTLLQLVLGTVYAWSFFQIPLMDTYSWNNTQVMWIFSIAIVFLGLTAALGGALLPSLGPRRLALAGVILYAAAYLIGSLAMTLHSLPLFYLGFGVIGGTGMGLGYVTPVATVAGWFPDKKGLVTGMVVMGFGLGALMMAKIIAPVLMDFTQSNLPVVFVWISAFILLWGLPAAWHLKAPPVEASSTVVGLSNEKTGITGKPVIRPALFSGIFLRIWLIFFLNISAGIIFIGWQSPMLQDLLRQSYPLLDSSSLAGYGATLIAVSSIFNGIGRMFWGGISDTLGRIQTFRLILATQALAFIILIYTANGWIFAILVCYVLLCYGGGFGTMPSYIADIYGEKLMPVMYGIVLTAWSAGGIVGPQFAAMVRDYHPESGSLIIFSIAAFMLTLALFIAFTLNNKAFRDILR